MEIPPRVKNLIGNKYGKLKVIDFFNLSKYGAVWHCKCECGNTKNILSNSLISKKSLSCGCNRKIKGKNHYLWNGFGDISGHSFSIIKSSINKRGVKRKLKFEVTIQEIWDLFIKQERKCALSGVELHFSDGKSYNGTASLDRKDSNGNYTINNVQWVHKSLNMMKQNNSDIDFIRWCKLVANHN